MEVDITHHIDAKHMERPLFSQLLPKNPIEEVQRIEIYF
jgi:hypothetical protein